MRRIAYLPTLIAALVLAVFAVMAYGEGRAEAKPMEIVVLLTPTTAIPADTAYKGPLKGKDLWAAIFAQFQTAHPEIKVHQIVVDLSTGSGMTMDALVASGQAPDVYFDAPMRTAKYMVPGFALALDKYVTDWEDFFPSGLDSARRGGKIYGLPWAMWATTLNLNVDLLAKAGYKVEPGWSIDDFLAMCRKVRDLKNGSYGTYLFAGNQSSDQWWMPWFAAFGAKYYAVGDYSRNTLNSPAAVKALNFMKSLVTEGYVRKDAASITDTEALTDFKAGKVAAGSMQAGHATGSPFAYRFVEFPRAAGVVPVGAAAGLTFAIVHESKDDARNRAAVAVAWAMTSPEAQRLNVSIVPGSYQSRKSVTDKGLLNERDDEILGVMHKNGVLDMGITMPKFTPIRSMMFPLLQQFYIGKMSAEDVLSRYEAAANKVLAEESRVLKPLPWWVTFPGSAN